MAIIVLLSQEEMEIFEVFVPLGRCHGVVRDPFGEIVPGRLLHLVSQLFEDGGSILGHVFGLAPVKYGCDQTIQDSL